MDKTIDTPLQTNIKFLLIDGELLSDPATHLHLVGEFIYLCIYRLNIAYKVGIVKQFVDVLRTNHYVARSCVISWFGYSFMIFSVTSSIQLYAYSDANFPGDPTTRSLP